MNPLVSVILPVYNGERFLPSAIRSILAQTFRDFELVAVDDGSTDDSRELLEGFGRTDSRVRVLSRPNTGIVGALNDGVAVAVGKYLARMDADDVSLPDRLARQVGFLEVHPQCVAVGSDVLYTDPEGLPLIRHRPAEAHDGIVAQLVEGNGGALVHPTVVFQRVAVEKVGGYRQEYKFIEDLDLFLRLSEIGELANMPDVLLHYRQHFMSINRTCGDRETLRRKVVAPYRARRGLRDLPDAVPDPKAPSCKADWRRHWAYDAVRGGSSRTAKKNAWLACLLRPLERRNWQCLRYAMKIAADHTRAVTI